MTTLRRVLVVDDDPAMSKLFARVLASKGFAVAAAGNGLEALHQLAHDDCAAVFTDIVMPGMDGIELAGRMRATQPSLPVVIMTGYGSADHRARAAAAGACGFLCKPLSAAMIATSLDAALAAAANSATPMPMQRAGAAGLIPDATPLTAAQADPVHQPGAGRSRAQVVKDIALFFAAPFITIAYLPLFPFIGLAMLAKARRQRREAA